jgi:serine/threonine-protein kinase RsbW
MSESATETVEFDRLPPRRARWFVRSVLTRWERTDVVEDAELLVDELVANAMIHARGRGVDVSVRCIGDTVRIAVSDRDPEFSIDFDRPEGAPARFGLRIIDSLATRWGVDPAPFGKVVWFDLDPKENRELEGLAES